MRTLHYLTLAAGLLAAGCGGGGDANAPPPVLPADAAAVHEAVRAADGKAVLVNFWATWCGPCVEEFPDLVETYRAHRADGLRVIFVSGDAPGQVDRVQRFLEGQGVDFTSYIKTGSDTEFIDGLDPAWSGAAPATWIYDAGGRRRAFWEGKASREQLERAVKDVLDNPS